MAKTKTIPLSSLKSGQKGEIISIIGGAEVIRKLDAMGIEVGENIKKIGSNLLRGPLIIEIKRTQIAIGRGIAQKILIEIQE